MDLVFQHDSFKHRDSVPAPGEPKNGHKLLVKQKLLPKRTYYFLGFYNNATLNPAETFKPSESAKAAYKLFSCIECTAVESKTEMFCLEIANYLHILAEFNHNIYKRRNAYPYSEELMDLLRIYVELEYETLYGNVSFAHSALQLQEPWEEKVVKRVLDVLYMMLPCCYDYFDDFHSGMVPFNVELSRDMHVFQVLKSTKLRYQKNPGFIKKAMREIIRSNGEMSAVIRGSLKSGQENSITKVWIDKSLAFLTEQQLHSSLTRTIPESADDCFKLYQLDITNLNINYDSPNELIELTGMEFEEMESLNDDDIDNITAYDIDRNAGDLVLNARKFLQPPPLLHSVSQQYIDSQNLVKQESIDNNDKDNDNSNTRDKGDLESGNASNSSNDNRKASIEKPANGKQRRSTHNEKIVGHIIVADDDDDEIIDNGVIVYISDDDDDDNVELVNESAVNVAINTKLEGDQNISIPSTSTNVIEEEPEIVDSLLAVLATQAVEKEKLQVDTRQPTDTTPKQVDQILTDKDALASIVPEDLSKEANNSSTSDNDSIQKNLSITESETTVIDAQTTSSNNEPNLIITEEELTIDPNIDKVVTESDPDVTLNQFSNAGGCPETPEKDALQTCSVIEALSINTENSSKLEENCIEILTESNLEVNSAYEEPPAMESTIIVNEEKEHPAFTLDEEKEIPLSTLDEEQENPLSTSDEEVKNPIDQERENPISTPAEETENTVIKTVIIEAKSIAALVNTKEFQQDKSAVECDLDATDTIPPVTEDIVLTIPNITESLVAQLNNECDSKNMSSTDSDVNVTTPTQCQPIISILSTESITAADDEVTKTVPENEQTVEQTQTPITDPEHQPKTPERDLDIAAIVTVQQQISEAISQDRVSEFPCQTMEADSEFENSKSKVETALTIEEGHSIVNDDELLTNASHTESIEETIITSTDPILTTRITTTETELTIEEAEAPPLSKDSKTNVTAQCVKVGNQLPERIPDVQTGSNLPRSRSTELLQNECQAKAINIRKQGETTKQSLPQLKRIVPHRSSERSITKSIENIHSLANKSPDKNTNRRNETTLVPTSFKEQARKSSAATTPVDTIGQSVAKSKMEGTKKKESVRTKAARKQGVEPITASEVCNTGSAAQTQSLTSDVPVPPSYNTSGDPLMSSIDLSSLDEVTMNTNKDYDHSKDDDTDKDKDVTNSQNINNDETVGAPVEDYLLPDVLLDMEIQTEQVSSAKETHEVIEIVDHTSNDVDTDPTKDDGNAQGEIQLIEHPRIVHKINNRTLSIDGRMAKSTMCCLESQKESSTWDTNDCTAGFCSVELRPQAYKTDHSDNVGLQQEDVEKFLLSGNVVRSSLEVLDDIRNMDTQQLFEQGVASEQCDEQTINDCRNVVINNSNIRMRIMNPSELSNIIKHPVNEFVVQHVHTEHPNIGHDKGQDPFILVNAIAVDSILAITNNKEQSYKEQHNTIESQIKIIEKEVAFATVGQFKGVPMQANSRDTQQRDSKETQQRLIRDLNSVENRRKEEPKVIVENLYDKLKQKPTKSYVQYYTPLPSDQKGSKRIQRRSNYSKKRKSTSTSSSTSNSPSQRSASPALSTSSSSSRNDTKKGIISKSISTGTTNASPYSPSNSSNKADIKKINITLNSHFDQEIKIKEQVNTTSTQNSTDATFNRLRNEYLFATTSVPSAAKPISPHSAKVNVTPKGSGINPEESKKLSKRSTTPITTSSYVKFDAQKGTVSTNVPSESVADFTQGSKKLNRRGDGSTSSSSSTTSSHGSSSSQKGHSKKSNINFVSEKLLQQQQWASEGQQQTGVGSSPANNTDYDELNRLDEVRRREVQNQKRLHMDIQLSTNNQNSLNSNSNPQLLRFPPQHMMYPHGYAGCNIKKSPYYSPGGSRQQDSIASQNPRVGTPGSTGTQYKQTVPNQEFRPWEESLDNTQPPYQSSHHLAGSSMGRNENIPKHLHKTPGKPKKQNRQIYQNMPNVSQPGTKLPEFW